MKNATAFICGILGTILVFYVGYCVGVVSEYSRAGIEKNEYCDKCRADYKFMDECCKLMYSKKIEQLEWQYRRDK